MRGRGYGGGGSGGEADIARERVSGEETWEEVQVGQEVTARRHFFCYGLRVGLVVMRLGNGTFESGRTMDGIRNSR